MKATEILESLGDKYSLQILEAADTPINAADIHEKYDIPIATCYRRIDDLVEQGLLEEYDSELNSNRRRATTYKRTIDEITVNFSDDNTTVELEEHTPDNTPSDHWQNTAQEVEAQHSP
ncbi:winged helix-turn-helix domain-containing protein [Salinibaculum rarum]|uniref:winged helix-turn-helix domain-containing protein n=1 Tax=Salinibaculum rarum TaxID=3058903 RepID=UPI00265F5ACE|nr:helix-turn-helix domain-containing protein [Salinibaculum sp. KK48]